MERYSVITDKNPREIVLLRGSGCKWRKCTFCDYHLDFSKKQDDNFEINAEVLSKVTGLYGKLEVINSGSFCDLDDKTIKLIIDTCIKNKIATVHFECHYIHRAEVEKIKKLFSGNNIAVKIKTGVETFDVNYRENILKKGFGSATPQNITEYADEVCLLFGLTGQTEESM
ncbi:MAG: radical SAM protein, partial [Acutalibacteraceae bacterium]|nr:radical SAM protein [Acutalibacteraceae bacterium]